MSSAQQQKAALRKAIRARRRELDPAWVQHASGRIQATVLGLDPFARARIVACYLALPHEVQTTGLLEACWQQGRRVCVPYFDEKRASCAWGWLEPGEHTRIGHWHILEPEDPRWARGNRPDLILAPAVALDPHGGRLGHGGGHYDRLLADDAVKVGLAFQFQVVDAVPMEPWDVRVDLIVTEERTYEVSKEELPA